MSYIIKSGPLFFVRMFDNKAPRFSDEYPDATIFPMKPIKTAKQCTDFVNSVEIISDYGLDTQTTHWRYDAPPAK